MNRWAEVVQKDSDPKGGGASGAQNRTISFPNCARLIETLPGLQHDPKGSEDVLKVAA